MHTQSASDDGGLNTIIAPPPSRSLQGVMQRGEDWGPKDRDHVSTTMEIIVRAVTDRIWASQGPDRELPKSTIKTRSSIIRRCAFCRDPRRRVQMGVDFDAHL